MDNPELEGMEDNRSQLIDNAEMMQGLLEDKRFQLLFNDLYIEAYAVTSLHNLWTFDDAQRRKYVENSLGRSIFTKFVNEVLEDGRAAIESYREDSADEQSTNEE